ncbi:hypothetical protein AgCh_037860 [Apium graveolens]
MFCLRPPWSSFRSQRLKFSVFDLFEVETKATKIDEGMRIGWFEEVGCWFRGQVKRNMVTYIFMQSKRLHINLLFQVNVIFTKKQGQARESVILV